MLTSLLVLSVAVSAVALWYARWEYKKSGKLSLFGLFLLCLMLFLPNLVLEYATSYRIPDSFLAWSGVAIGASGLLLCVASIVIFRSPIKVLCLDAGALTVTGPYRWSRNPQYVGWVMFVLGFALTDWSWWCFGAVAVIGISIHLLVIIEEEHLHRVFGEKYDAFWRRVPQYVGWPR